MRIAGGWLPFAGALLVALTLAGCAPLRAVKPSMDTLEYRVSPGAPRVLLVLLPGRGSAAEDFETHGFIDAVEHRDAGIDVIAVDAHLGYYKDRSLPRRLWEQVIKPKQDEGYDEIWIVGTSMGGFGAVAYAQRYGTSISGIMLLSPYLGPEKLQKEIELAGGLEAWTPAAGADDFAEIWSWLQGYPRGETRPKMLLAFGTSDRMNRGHELLADALPSHSVVRVDGGHGWAVWDPLWPQLLAAEFASGTD